MQPKQSYLGPLSIILVGGIALLALNCPVLLTYLIQAVFWAAIAAAAGVIGYVIYWLIRNQLSPVTRVRARVVRRRFKEWDVSLPADSPEMAAARLGMMGRDPQAAWKAYSRAAVTSDATDLDIVSGKDYYVTFSINGREVEFAVPEQSYIAASEGIEGLLVYQGEQFNNFIPHVQ